MITKKEIKELRNLLGLKQTELAGIIGVSVNTIQNYEAGKVIPMAKQLLIENMLENARGKINNTGDGNVIGNIGGHNVHLSIPESIKPKIINDDEIVITCEDSLSQEAQRKTEALILENQALKEKIDLKDELIQSLRDQIEILKGNKS